MFKFKDKRTQGGKAKYSYIARVNPIVIAKLVKENVFPHAPVPSMIFITLTDEGYTAKKVFVGGYNNFHTATVKFTDFETTGDFAEIIKPVIEESKKSILGKEYIEALKQRQSIQEK